MAELYRDAPPLARDAHYVTCRTDVPRERLLAGSGDVWNPVPSIAWGPDRFLTTCRALWTDEALVVRFDARDEHPWHVHARRDDSLWDEEVVEIFLDPSGSGANYAEVEISPANVVCDLQVASPWPALASDKTWDWAGLETRVHHRPAPDAPGHVTWQAIAWMPWDGLRSLAGAAAVRLPPRTGDRWRMNVFRIKRPGGPGDRERGAIYAAWSVPTEGPSFHVPDAFRDLVFAA